MIRYFCLSISSLILIIHLSYLFKQQYDTLEPLPFSLVQRLSHQYNIFFRYFNHSTQNITKNTLEIDNIFKANITHENIQELDVVLSIHVFAWRRSKSLNRLLQSLNNADYLKKTVCLYIHVDGNPSIQVMNVIKQFTWKFGPEYTIINIQEMNLGLKKIMLNAWTEQDPSTHAIFLEDDTSVSPLYFQYAYNCAKIFLNHEKINSNVFGCSLYTPRLDEISPTNDTQHPPLWNPSLVIGHTYKIFAYQLPCSWGTIYSREKWKHFREYLTHRLSLNSTDKIFVPDSRSNIWGQSWKRFLIEFMYSKGLVEIYPNFENQKSFSTNHYEEGVHSVPEGMIPKIPDILRTVSDDRFQVPLFRKNESLMAFIDIPKTIHDRITWEKKGRIPILSLYNKRTNYPELIKQGKMWLKRVEIQDRTAYNILTKTVS